MQGLPKNRILRGYRAFSRVLSQGHKKTSGSIRCFYVPAERGTATPTVGFAVIRAVRKAAWRNRAKRLMREAYRRNRSSLFAGGKCIAAEIVFLYTGVERKDFKEAIVERDIVSLLQRLKN